MIFQIGLNLLIRLPRLGPDLSIDMDKVESLKPDLVLASLSVPGMEKNIEELKKRNIPHIILDPQSLNDIADDLLLVGQKCGIEERAKIVHAEYLAFIDEMKKRASTVTNTPTLYWEWWPKPIFTPGRINWLTEISTIAGGLNEFRDVELASVQTDWEDVLQRNPDYILLAWVGVRTEKVNKNVILKRPGWRELPAITNNQFIYYGRRIILSPFPTSSRRCFKA